MMKTRSTLGEVATGTLLLIVLAGVVVGWVAPKPKFLDSRTRDAKASVEASAEVERRVSEAVAAEQAKGAQVAASVQQIGVAAGQLPDSPQKTFIVREGVWLSPLLPPADPAALLAAERRRVAIMEGKVELADKLYAKAAADNAALLARAAKAEAKLVAAMSERREVDTQLAESAAYQRGQQQVIGVLSAIVVLIAAGWIYASLRAGKLSRLARKFIPALDAAYDDAPEATRQVLDSTVFDRLSKAMDGAEKKLVHAIRSKL